MTKELSRRLAGTVLVFACVTAAQCARADTISITPTRGLQEALSGVDAIGLFNGHAPNGSLTIGGNLFSGRASGTDPKPYGYYQDELDNNLHLDRTAELEGEQRVYALLIDGNFDFDNDLGTGLPVHPYVSGGIGMAMYGNGTTGLGMQSGDMVPLFRLGGGVTYRLGAQWNLSLDYKEGFSGAGDQIFTGRAQQSVDLHVLNMGMHYKF